MKNKIANAAMIAFLTAGFFGSLWLAVFHGGV